MAAPGAMWGGRLRLPQDEARDFRKGLEKSLKAWVKDRAGRAEGLENFARQHSHRRET